MAGRGPTPKEERRRRADPIRGDWQATADGWQHGPAPIAPDGLVEASRDAWQTWFAAWFASHWSPDDLPALRQIIRLYDQVERGEFQRSTELRLMMDTYGITPKGQQDRRWAKPKQEDTDRVTVAKGGHYEHLKVVGGVQ